MEILVLGAGGREHALGWRLARDERVRRVRFAPGNGGTAAIGPSVEGLDPLQPVEVARHASRERYDLVVIGPEAPLAAGVTDALRQAGIPVFGPSRAAARLESSKAFAKEVMARSGVPTAEARSFSDPAPALAHARRLDRPLVVKADWLAAGKGVIVPDDPQGTIAAIGEVFATAPRGGSVLLEERLEGREVSMFALVSDERVVPLAAACDYKRLGDGDTGPNTGGMGAYAPVPWFGARQLEEVTEQLLEPVAWRLSRDGTPYRGVLYAGLMLTDGGPMVLEFNARFGDPEAQVLLPLLEGDLAGALLGTADGDPAAMEGSIGLGAGAAAGVVVAAPGYPAAPRVGGAINGVEPSSAAEDGDLLCFHAATSRGRGGFVASGGRVVTFVGRGPTLAAARQAAYSGVAGARLDGGQHRSDIALREVG